jgi:hypothetical protein
MTSGIDLGHLGADLSILRRKKNASFTPKKINTKFVFFLFTTWQFKKNETK